MKLSVKGQQITVVDPYLYVSDTENVYTVEYEFSDEWEGYAKTAVFHGNGHDIDVVLTGNSCVIPSEVIAESGYIKFGVYGIKTEGGATKRYPTVYSNPFFVDIGCKEGTSPLPPTPDVYAQLLEAYTQTNKRVDDVEDGIGAIEIRLGADENAITELQSDVGELENTKVDKEDGKGLSTNDYTDEEKQKLAGLENYDDAEVKERLTDIEDKEAEWDAKADQGDIDSAISTEDTEVKSWVENKGYSIVSETGYRIDLECDSSTYELKARLYDKNNVLLSTSTVIDLPIETLITNITYDSTTKELVITLKSGATVRVPIGAIVSGLATQDFVRDYTYGKNDVFTKTEINSMLSDMATKTWVGQQGFLTEHQSLDAYRTADEQDEIDEGFVSKTSLLTTKDDEATDEDVYSAKAMNTELEDVVRSDDEDETGDAQINADQLNGHADTYFAKQSDLEEVTDEVADKMSASDYDANRAVKSAGGIAQYVANNGGKIDHIALNGTEQQIVNKTVNLNIPYITYDEEEE